MSKTKSKTRNHAGNRDADLLALEADYLAIEAAMADAGEAARDAATDRGMAIRWRMAHRRAHTPAGMAAKARLLVEAAATGGAEWHEPLARGLLADIERLGRLQA